MRKAILTKFIHLLFLALVLNTFIALVVTSSVLLKRSREDMHFALESVDRMLDYTGVEVLTVDDRMEHCEGVKPVTVGEHEALKGIPTDWPEVLGYNKVIAKPEAEVPVTVEGDPFIAFASYGKGRSGVVTTDCAPHWAPPEFCEWEYYNKLWQNIADWLIQK